MSTRLFDEFISTRVGEPFRLFPFGQIVKNGQKREITPEYARQFRLPHFKPPIKLGSHGDDTAAGGHIIELLVRDDGLYAVPEWNEKGTQALKDGAYRYQSPEVIFDDDRGLENPQTGDLMKGPLVLGDALLHTPHLGELAALYSIEPIENKEKDMAENISVPVGLWEKFTALLDAKLNPTEPEKIEVVPEDYEAAKKERDEFATRLQAIEDEATHKELVAKFEGELQETKADPEMADILADLPEEKAEAIMKQFRALSEQINESNLTEEKGTEGEGLVDPQAQFNAAVLAYASEKGKSYTQAFEAIKVEKPELFADAFARKK